MKENESGSHRNEGIDLTSYGSQTGTHSVDALARLHRHEYVVRISDRIDDHTRYPFRGHKQLLDVVLQSITHGDSVLLVGEPGIGKRTMSLGLARRFSALRRSHPGDPVFSRDVYTLSLGSSFWNGAQDEDIRDIQDSIRRVFRLVEEAGPEKIVFCIDDIDVLSFVDRLVKETGTDALGTGELARDMNGSTLSAENMLRFLLFGKKVLCLCTCIKDAYIRLQRSDTYYDEKFTKSFRVLHMPEPTVELAKDIAFAHRDRLEADHSVTIPDESVDAAVIYGNMYITHRALPESALDLLHEASKRACTTRTENLNRSSGEKDVADIRTQLEQLNLHPVVHKYFVDRLVKEWCGVSQTQLDRCIAISNTHDSP